MSKYNIFSHLFFFITLIKKTFFFCFSGGKKEETLFIPLPRRWYFFFNFFCSNPARFFSPSFARSFIFLFQFSSFVKTLFPPSIMFICHIRSQNLNNVNLLLWNFKVWQNCKPLEVESPRQCKPTKKRKILNILYDFYIHCFSWVFLLKNKQRPHMQIYVRQIKS
jgi:hypothetical protein